MKSTLLFSSTNVKEIYKLYEILNADFLKEFKCSAEFNITTFSSSREFSLSAQDVSVQQFKWLQDATLEIVEKNFGKIVDKP